jgi:hypothetical protein
LEILAVALRKTTKIIVHEGTNALLLDLIYLVELLREIRNVHNKTTGTPQRNGPLGMKGAIMLKQS